MNSGIMNARNMNPRNMNPETLHPGIMNIRKNEAYIKMKEIYPHPASERKISPIFLRDSFRYLD